MIHEIYYVYDAQGNFICQVNAVSSGGAITVAINKGYVNAYSAVASKERNK